MKRILSTARNTVKQYIFSINLQATPELILAFDDEKPAMLLWKIENCRQSSPKHHFENQHFRWKHCNH